MRSGLLHYWEGVPLRLDTHRPSSQVEVPFRNPDLRTFLAAGYKKLPLRVDMLMAEIVLDPFAVAVVVLVDIVVVAAAAAIHRCLPC